MKSKTLNTAFNAGQSITLFCILALLLCFMQFATPIMVFSSDTDSSVEISELDGPIETKWADTGVTVINAIQKGFVKILMALVVVCALGALAVLLFAKDERVVGPAVKWLVRIGICAFIIVLVNNDVALDIIKNFAEQVTT